MDINNYMTPTEAAYRWGISYNTLQERFKDSRRNEEEIQAFINEGLLKYFVKPEGKRGEWIISTTAMEKWYGEELFLG
ncbi:MULTISPECIES: helix-turn-helix domain-containing protein [Viridibacillus]|uniref:Uncharacterized protein n=2 Tax=Viridibacillus TaxID=496496 RepID=W4EMC3_9BACL|nr:hypothetical protein C176_19489 [Viridibacillus arenosi FSL R5-213]